MQFWYEHIHVYSGLPWGGSIILAAALYRLVILFYPMMIVSDQGARSLAMAPVATPLMQKLRDAPDKETKQALQMEWMAMRKVAGLSNFKLFGPSLLQGFLGFGTFRLLREMNAIPVPRLEDGGFLWFTDLTVADPYFILPVALFASMHYIMKVVPRLLLLYDS